MTVPALALIVGGALGVCFVRRQSRLDDPLMDLALRRPALAIVLAGLLLGGVLLTGVGLLVTQYLQSVLAYAPAAAALLFTPMGLAMAMGTLLAPRLVRCAGRTPLISGGMTLPSTHRPRVAQPTDELGRLVKRTRADLTFLTRINTDRRKLPHSIAGPDRRQQMELPGVHDEH